MARADLETVRNPVRRALLSDGQSTIRRPVAESSSAPPCRGVIPRISPAWTLASQNAARVDNLTESCRTCAPPSIPLTDLHPGVVITQNQSSRASRARIATIAAASLALASGSLALAAPSQAQAPRPAAKAIAGSHPQWATGKADRGAEAASAQFTGTVYLQGQDPAGAAAYAAAVSNQNDPNYRHFLSPDAFRARFGVTDAQLGAVQSWLKGSGLTVLSTTQHEVTFRGDNAAVTKAFGTSVHSYAVAGQSVHAPAAGLTVPAAVANTVLGVAGLSSELGTVAKPQSVKVSDSVAGTGSKPGDGLPTVSTCSDYWGQKTATGAPAGYVKGAVPFDQCSFQPSQLRKAYGITASGLTGKGATVAIVDAYASSTMLQDANTFSAAHGDKPFKSGQYTEVVTPSQWNSQAACGGPAGWQGEESLDVEMVHGLAPDAKVVYVGANSCNDNDLIAALSNIVDNHLADVVSNSWSEIMHTTDQGDMTQATIQAYEQVFEQGAIEGMGFDFSAGDCGDQSPTAAATGVNCQTDTPRAQVGFPSSDPWVTDVGGTALGLASKSGKYGFETSMGTLRSALSADGTSWTPLPGAFYFGGGGGTSEDFAQPWYQRGTVPNSLSHTLMTGAHSATAQRVTPDVAMNGDLYTSVLVGMTSGGTYSEGGYGGTSVSAPEFSAVQADAIQAQGGAIGFANPEIYARSSMGLFRDVVNRAAAEHKAPLSNVVDFGMIGGSLKVRLVAFGEDTSLQATRGYDDATGVGSPTQAYLDSFLWGRMR
ncbi:protease pro-enzyme activation domain-containing protein [Streptacidiphilus sp. BW17]|uniref:S53 family peptidase n=1 Tax=unclassified Streptacidiphilus TaxID=2643834 RepID=UPI003512821A